MVVVKPSESSDEILRRGHKLFTEKFMEFQQEVVVMSRFNYQDTILEFGLGVRVFLTFILALANNDLYLCVNLLKLMETIDPLLFNIKYIISQMVVGFKLKPEIILSAVEYLKKLEQSRLINIPKNVTDMLDHSFDYFTSNISTNGNLLVPEEMSSPEETERVKESSSAPVGLPDMLDGRVVKEGESYQLKQSEPAQEEVVNSRTEPEKELVNLHTVMDIIKACIGNAPVHGAVINKNISGLKFLLKIGADVNVLNQKGETCLLLAAKTGQREIVELLLENGADPNLCDENGISPLFAAVKFGEPSLFEMLLNKGANIRHENNEGFSVLYWSVKYATEEISLLLKEMGAILFPDDICDAARTYTDCKKMILLRELGADFKAKDKGGHTPLHWAVDTDNLAVVKFLVESGADPLASASTITGWTPLHRAVDRNNEPIIRYFVKSGVDPNTLDSKGRTALYYAKAWKKRKVAAYLQSLKDKK